MGGVWCVPKVFEEKKQKLDIKSVAVSLSCSFFADCTFHLPRTRFLKIYTPSFTHCLANSILSLDHPNGKLPLPPARNPEFKLGMMPVTMPSAFHFIDDATRSTVDALEKKGRLDTKKAIVHVAVPCTEFNYRLFHSQALGEGDLLGKLDRINYTTSSATARSPAPSSSSAGTTTTGRTC